MSKLVRARTKRRAEYPPELRCPAQHEVSDGAHAEMIVDLSDLISNVPFYCFICRVLRPEHPQTGVMVVAGRMAGHYAALATLDLDEAPFSEVEP